MSCEVGIRCECVDERSLHGSIVVIAAGIEGAIHQHLAALLAGRRHMEGRGKKIADRGAYAAHWTGL